MDSLLGMIILWPGNFVPVGWFLCDGRVLNIQQYAALYSILGVVYGGNGTTTFGLPDLRGCVAIGIGQRVGSATTYTIAQKGGEESIVLTQAQIPAHTHTGALSGSATGTLPALSATGSLPATINPGTSGTPGPALFPAKVPDYGSEGISPNYVYGASDNTTKMPVTVAIPAGQNLPINLSGGTAAVTVGTTGGGLLHDNMQPFLALSYIIAVEGLYPGKP